MDSPGSWSTSSPESTFAAGREDDPTPEFGLLAGPLPTDEATVEEQAFEITPIEQGIGDVSFVDRGWHDGPGSDEVALEVGEDRQAKAVEPFSVGGIAAEAREEVVRARPIPRWTALPTGMLDRQDAGVDLAPRIGREGLDEFLANEFWGAPEPANPPIELALDRQVGKETKPVRSDLLEEAVLAAPTEELADGADRQDFAVRAARLGTGTNWDDHSTLLEQIIDEHVDLQKQVFVSEHGLNSRIAVWLSPNNDKGVFP